MTFLYVHFTVVTINQIFLHWPISVKL